MDFYSLIVINIVSGLCVAFILFISAIIFIKPRIKISSKIAHGVNYSINEKGGRAFKFKIVNKSYFITAHDFEFQP